MPRSLLNAPDWFAGCLWSPHLQLMACGIPLGWRFEPSATLKLPLVEWLTEAISILACSCCVIHSSTHQLGKARF